MGNGDETVGDFPRSFYIRLSQIFCYLAEPREEHFDRGRVRHNALNINSTYLSSMLWKRSVNEIERVLMQMRGHMIRKKLIDTSGTWSGFSPVTASLGNFLT